METETDTPMQPLTQLAPRERIDVLLAEYHALYGLAQFRMGALDKRVPAAGAAIVAFLSGVPLLPEPAGLVLLTVIPASLIWFVRTTINHARSFEDLIRRIEQVERAVNAIAGESLICFQSTHPSRGRAVGGRTGFETVTAAGLASALIIGACATLSLNQSADTTLILMYLAYLTGIAGYLLSLLRQISQYRYQVGH